jgi:molybdenum cofactor cytidylyltransferase
VIAAVVPAAGRSERMGQPKLVLPIRGEPLIARVVSALRGGGVGLVVVVTPPPSAPETAAISELARGAGAVIVSPAERPADMRASFERGLDCIERTVMPHAVFLVPGDSPGLSASVVSRLIGEFNHLPDKIYVPALLGRRGHPLLLPWNVATKTRNLAPDRGVNSLLAEHHASVATVEMPGEPILADLDTPDDYRAWKA